MDAGISVFIDSAQMGNHDASELTMRHRCTGFVYVIVFAQPTPGVRLATDIAGQR